MVVVVSKAMITLSERQTKELFEKTIIITETNHKNMIAEKIYTRFVLNVVSFRKR